MKQKRSVSSSLTTDQIDLAVCDVVNLTVTYLRRLVPRAQVIRIEAIEYTDEPEPEDSGESHPEWKACKS